jgi:hypothetical protein
MPLQVWTSKADWKVALPILTPLEGGKCVATEVGRLPFKGVKEHIDVMEVRLKVSSDTTE